MRNLAYYGDWGSYEVYIIDIDAMEKAAVVTEVGDDPYNIDKQGPDKAYALTTPEDFGGSLSTGHPLWVKDTQFFILDHAAREIQLWEGEGNQAQKVSPGVFRFQNCTGCSGHPGRSRSRQDTHS